MGWTGVLFTSCLIVFFLKHSNILQNILVSLSIDPAFDQDFEGKLVS